ncbi:MAG TPA: DUF6519 domain-containing protein [Thermoanaerobaculia bacterium]|nr:DUF6519 domain-containing protein [Thermoanaerobaculia bacterium]
MKGDFSRLTFDPAKRYTSVRRQQGRLQLDADWNEQADLFLQQVEAFAGDLIGAAGAPAPELATLLVRVGGIISSSGLNLIGAPPPAGVSDARPGIDAIFQDDLRPGMTVFAAGQSRVVVNVVDDQNAVLDRPFEPDLAPGAVLQVSGSGRVRSTGKALVGTGTEFGIQVQEGGEIEVGGQQRTVGKIYSTTFLLVTQPFSPDLPPPSHFQVSVSGGDVKVGAGRYYVGGMLCELEADTPLTAQPDLPGYSLPAADGRYLAYLEARELHETAVDWPDLAEPALGGPDTASRTRVVAAVRLAPVGATAACDAFTGLTLPGMAPPFALAARATSPPLADRLYRVEVHTGGALGTATFKWARDNATALAPVESLSPGEITVASPVGLDGDNAFAAGQWVEVTDRQRTLAGEPGVLVRLSQVLGQALTVEAWPGGTAPTLGDGAVLRRWDSEGDAVVTAASFLPLEDGIEVGFAADALARALPGDAWLIPARQETGGVLWPQTAGAPASLPPQAGRPRRYAPLALLDRTDGVWTVKSDCRAELGHLSERASLDTKVNVSGDIMTGPLFIDSDLAVTGTVRAGTTLTPGISPAVVKLEVQGGDLQLAPGSDAQSGILFPLIPPTGTPASQGFVRFHQPFNSGPRLVFGTTGGAGDAVALSQGGVDRLVVASGRVGVGRSPGTDLDGLQLDVQGKMQAADLRIEGPVTIARGTATVGSVLTSNPFGVASWQALTSANRGRPVFFTTPSRIGVGSGTGPQAETPFTFAAGGQLPAGATAVILEGRAAADDGDGRIWIFTGTGASRRLLLRARATGGGDRGGWSSQGVFPLADGSFRYIVVEEVSPSFNGGWSLTAIGYYP